MRSASVRRVVLVTLREPDLLAARLEIEEAGQQKRTRQRQRRGPHEAPTQRTEDQTAVDRVSYEPVGTRLHEPRALERPGERREVLPEVQHAAQRENAAAADQDGAEGYADRRRPGTVSYTHLR